MNFHSTGLRARRLVASISSQSISAGSTFDWNITIPIFGSAFHGHLLSLALNGSPTSGYTGGAIELRSASGADAAGMSYLWNYPSAFSSQLITWLSEQGQFGFSIRFDDGWIDNANSRITLRFRNTSGAPNVFSARLQGTVIP